MCVRRSVLCVCMLGKVLCVCQAEYVEEAIGWNMADFTDNRPCLDLLEGSPGIFALLNEVQCHESHVS